MNDTLHTARPGGRVRGSVPLLGLCMALGLIGASLIADRSAVAPLPDAVVRSVDGITSRELRATVAYLSSHELQGRGTGHPGNEAAVRFLASRLEDLGVEPGRGPSYLQPFELLTGSLGKDNTFEMLGADENGRSGAQFQQGRDFDPVLHTASASVSAPLAFAGYGISAPGQGYDSYAGLEIVGRIVVLLEGRPHTWKGPAAATAADPAAEGARVLAAQERGAAAVVLVTDQQSQEFSRRARKAWPRRPSIREARFVRAALLYQIPVVRVSGRSGAALLGLGEVPQSDLAALRNRVASEPSSARSIDRQLVERPRRARLTVDIERRTVTSHNVVGYLEGRDPASRDELVVIGAHLDHDGIDARGRVYNGADDNASGTAGVLEIAGAFAEAAARGQRPRRTVVFAFWNAEEKGLLGSSHYVEQPLPSPGRPVVKLNLDMIGRREEVPDQPDPRFRGLPPKRPEASANSVHLLGYSYSPELAAIVEHENEAVGLVIKSEYDDHALDLIRRSDHWPFLQRRIPSAFLTTALHPDYHTPDDDVDRLDFEKMERIVRLAYRVAWRVADAPGVPGYAEPALATVEQ
jgi:hypothetical protein